MVKHLIVHVYDSGGVREVIRDDITFLRNNGLFQKESITYLILNHTQRPLTELEGDNVLILNMATESSLIQDIKQKVHETIKKISPTFCWCEPHFSIFIPKEFKLILDIHFLYKEYFKRLLREDLSFYSHNVELNDFKELSLGHVQRRILFETEAFTRCVGIISNSLSTQNHAMDFSGARKVPAFVGLLNTQLNIPIASLNSGGHKKKLLYFGRFSLQKGLHRILSSPPPAHIHIDFIGFEEKHLSMLKKLDLPASLQFYPWIEDLKTKERLEYDGIIYPSLYEPFGLSLAQGILTDVPILATPVDGHLEQLGPGDSFYSDFTGKWWEGFQARDKNSFPKETGPMRYEAIEKTLFYFSKHL